MNQTNRINIAFEKSPTLIIPYLTAGDPDLQTTRQSILSLVEAGAGMIELGIPFTDPMADGPTIQKSAERALKNPFSLDAIFAMTKQLRDEDQIDVPLVLMTYANPVFRYGFDRFCENSVAHGIDALLITDMPPEESEDYLTCARKSGLGTVFLCSPTTSPERLKLIDQCSTAYVYYVARTGVTGATASLPENLIEKLTDVKSQLQHNKLCAGFGISTPEHVTDLTPHVDGVIVGSALVRLFEEHQGTELQDKIQDYTKSLAEATQTVPVSGQNLALKL